MYYAGYGNLKEDGDACLEDGVACFGTEEERDAWVNDVIAFPKYAYTEDDVAKLHVESWDEVEDALGVKWKIISILGDFD